MSTNDSTIESAPLSPVEAKNKLERALADRPEKKDLVDRNILKDSGVAPALQAAQDHLKRSQLEDKLGHALAKRPTADELVKEGILQPDEVPPSK